MGLRALLAGVALALVTGAAAPEALAREPEHLTNYDRMLLERDGGASVGMNFSVRFGGDRREERVPTWSFGLSREADMRRQNFDVLSYRFQDDARIETPLALRDGGGGAWRPAFTMKTPKGKPLVGLRIAEDDALLPAF